VLKMIFPGVRAVEVTGEPPGNTQEYLVAMEVVLKETAPPAGMAVSKAGAAMTPLGGTVA
jgi:hypothetical protein